MFGFSRMKVDICASGIIIYELDLMKGFGRNGLSFYLIKQRSVRTDVEG